MSRKFASVIAPIPRKVSVPSPIAELTYVGIEDLDNYIAETNLTISHANRLRDNFMEASELGLESVQELTLKSLQELLPTESGLGLEYYSDTQGVGLESGIGGFFKKIWEKIKAFFAWIWNKITGIFKTKGRDVKDLDAKLSDSEGELADAMQDFSEALKDNLEASVKIYQKVIKDAPNDDAIDGEFSVIHPKEITPGDLLETGEETSLGESTLVVDNIATITSVELTDILEKMEGGRNGTQATNSGGVSNGYLLLPRKTPIKSMLDKDEHLLLINSPLLANVATSKGLGNFLKIFNEQTSRINTFLSGNIYKVLENAELLTNAVMSQNLDSSSRKTLKNIDHYISTSPADGGELFTYDLKDYPNAKFIYGGHDVFNLINFGAEGLGTDSLKVFQLNKLESSEKKFAVVRAKDLTEFHKGCKDALITCLLYTSEAETVHRTGWLSSIG